MLNFWKFTSYCKPLWSGMGESSAGSYLANPTSPIPSHCASIVVTSTVRVKALWPKNYWREGVGEMESGILIKCTTTPPRTWKVSDFKSKNCKNELNPYFRLRKLEGPTPLPLPTSFHHCETKWPLFFHIIVPILPTIFGEFILVLGVLNSSYVVLLQNPSSTAGRDRIDT